MIVTLLGLEAVPIVPLNLVPEVLLLVSLNIADAISDLVTTYWLLGKPKGLLVLDHGDIMYVSSCPGKKPKCKVKTGESLMLIIEINKIGN